CKMRIGNIITALFCVFIGAMFLLLSKDFPKTISNAPGPGFYPSIISWLLILLGLILLIQSLVSSKKQEIEMALMSPPAKFVYKICGISVICSVLFKFIGFAVIAFLFILVTSYMMGLRKYTLLLIIPLAVTI